MFDSGSTVLALAALDKSSVVVAFESRRSYQSMYIELLDFVFGE